MADEASLLALVRDNPRDGAAHLVYADWLEERGNAGRAEIVRALHPLALATLDTPNVVERARALLAASRVEDPAWRTAIDRRLLVGTVWATKSNSGEAGLLGFLPDGKLVFRRESGQWPGTWSAVGNAVELTINEYSPHEGAFFGDRMSGNAWNKGSQRWNWGAVRMPDPRVLDAAEFPDVPDDTPKDTEYVRDKPKRARRQSAGE